MTNNLLNFFKLLVDTLINLWKICIAFKYFLVNFKPHFLLTLIQNFRHLLKNIVILKDGRDLLNILSHSINSKKFRLSYQWVDLAVLLEYIEVILLFLWLFFHINTVWHKVFIRLVENNHAIALIGTLGLVWKDIIYWNVYRLVEILLQKFFVGLGGFQTKSFES